MERRQFLKTITAGTLGMRLCPYISLSGLTGLTGCGESGISDNETSDSEFFNAEYYDTELLLRFFDFSVFGEKDFWISTFGMDTARKIILEAKNEFEEMIPEIPYLGKRNDKITELPFDTEISSYKFLSLFGSYLNLSRYKALKKRSMNLEDISRLLYEAQRDSYSKLPFEYRLSYNQNWFNIENQKMMCAESEKRLYEDDWVASFVEGDGVEFDFGIDITECGPTNFFPSQGAEEFVSSICPIDDLLSDACGLGLVRTKLISKGDDRCNFRYKRQSIY